MRSIRCWTAKLSQADAAKVLGVTQPKVSALRHYKLAGFSVERLMNLLTALDQDVEIVIRPEPRLRKAAGSASLRPDLGGGVCDSVASLREAHMRCTARSLYRGIALIALFAFPSAAYAHEKWFANAKALSHAVGAAVRVSADRRRLARAGRHLVLAIVWRRSGGRALLPGPEALGATPAGRARFYALVPLILGIHVGVPLIVLGSADSCSRRTIRSPDRGCTGWASCRSASA